MACSTRLGMTWTECLLKWTACMKPTVSYLLVPASL